MAVRQDGQDTKQKILEISAKYFAERGYSDTRVSDICKEVGANLAAVNYHFGSKEKLYVEVWKKAFADALKIYPIDGGLGENAPPEELLKASTIRELKGELLRRVFKGFPDLPPEGILAGEGRSMSLISSELQRYLADEKIAAYVEAAA